MTSKYHRTITKRVQAESIIEQEDGTFAVSVSLDFYDIAHAWKINNPATQPCMKKLFMPGAREAKGLIEDMKEAHW